MKKVLIALAAAIGPLLYSIAIAVVSLNAQQYIKEGLDLGILSLSCLWYFLWGILVAFLLYLTISIFPRHGGRGLIWGAGIGGVLVLYLALRYIMPEVFWVVLPFHFHMEPLTMLSVNGLFLAGNIICIIRTLMRNKKVES